MNSIDETIGVCIVVIYWSQAFTSPISENIVTTLIDYALTDLAGILGGEFGKLTPRLAA